MKYDNIQFFNEDISYRLRNKKSLRSWIKDTIHHENRITGSLNFIFCSDQILYKLNISYLEHDSFTDVIAFDYSDENGVVSGDIYISIDRVKENAWQYKVIFKDELHRVMIHGLLHLMNYTDDTLKKKNLMRRNENKYLNMRSSNL
ncbi:MAG: rRNA maturation RNase YbeY [Bacteroidetes bacterium]|nr:rRNA maturation RNase YbeY [Bacteroidota bacterium]